MGGNLRLLLNWVEIFWGNQGANMRIAGQKEYKPMYRTDIHRGNKLKTQLQRGNPWEELVIILHQYSKSYRMGFK